MTRSVRFIFDLANADCRRVYIYFRSLLGLGGHACRMTADLQSQPRSPLPDPEDTRSQVSRGDLLFNRRDADVSPRSP